MPTLAERLRAARETWVTVEGVELLIRRPTALEATELARAGAVERLRATVVGWRGVTEQTLRVPGGTADPVPFDADTFVEWVADQPKVLVGVSEEIKRIVEAHKARREALEKN